MSDLNQTVVDCMVDGGVAIVGCGPAGAFFALQLLRHGVSPSRIVMFDRARFPRPKLCGGGITFRGTQLLSAAGLTPVARWQSAELRLTWAGRSFSIREPGEQWLVDRSYFDDFLLAQCRAAGIRIHEGQALQRVVADGLGWRLGFQGGGEHRCLWLIGADGANSSVRRLLGCPSGRVGRLVEGVFTPGAAAKPAPETLEFSFDALAAGIPGYGWIFPYPKPGGGLAYKIGVMDGMGVVPGGRLRAWTLAYAEAAGFEPVGELAGWTEHYFGLDNVGHRPGMLLVGEAYGIDPLLGEGITPALEHAAYAAERQAAALAAKRLSIGGFERAYLWREAGWNLFFQRFLADRLYTKNSQRWLDRLFASRRLQSLGQGGSVAYGQMARRPFTLVTGLAEGWLRNG